jgi:hypothetical protein
MTVRVKFHELFSNLFICLVSLFPATLLAQDALPKGRVATSLFDKRPPKNPALDGLSAWLEADVVQKDVSSGLQFQLKIKNSSDRVIGLLDREDLTYLKVDDGNGKHLTLPAVSCQMTDYTKLFTAPMPDTFCRKLTSPLEPASQQHLSEGRCPKPKIANYMGAPLL